MVASPRLALNIPLVPATAFASIQVRNQKGRRGEHEERLHEVVCNTKCCILRALAKNPGMPVGRHSPETSHPAEFSCSHPLGPFPRIGDWVPGASRCHQTRFPLVPSSS